MITQRSIAIWITAFLTFLSSVATFGSAYLLLTEGASATITPYLLSMILGSQTAELYLWICIAATAIFLAITCIIVYRKEPPNPEIIKMLLKVGGNIAALKKSQEASMAEIANQMEYNRKVNRKILTDFGEEMKENSKQTVDLVASQGKASKKAHSDMLLAVDKAAAETGEKVSANILKQEATITGVKRLGEENGKVLKAQQKELAEIKTKLASIEGNMTQREAELKSSDNPEEIKGIGPALGKELRALGIASVGDFLTTDPEVIGDKTRVTPEMAAQLQAAAQLTMIPKIDANDAELLVEAGIKSRKQLADQELIELSRKVNELAKIYLAQGKITKEEYPTIEEISAWIRNAR